MIVDGRKISDEIKKDLKDRVSKLNCVPMLVAIQVGSLSASESYLRIKEKFAEGSGIVFELSKFSEDITTEELVDRITVISKDSLVHGIIVQLPLPEHIDREAVLDAIPTEKDPDVLSQESRRLWKKSPVVLAVEHILNRHNVNLLNKRIVILGQGSLVGKPITEWIQREGLKPVVMTKETFNLEKIKEADILITGVGNPELIKSTDLKRGVVIIDAGTSEQGGELKGDVEKSAGGIASLFTPVPGGVGPIAVAKLFENLIGLISAKSRDF